MSRRRPSGDDGSVLVLMLGLFAVLLVLVGVVVDLSVVILAKRSLASAADGAAVSAAQAIDYGVFYSRGPGQGVPLSEDDVRSRVGTYADAAMQGQPGLELAGRVEGGYTAVVTATRTVGLPFGGWVGVQAVDLSAVAHASAPLVVGP